MDLQTEKKIYKIKIGFLTIKPCIPSAFGDIYIFIRVYMKILASKLNGVPVTSEDLETSFCNMTNPSIK